MALLAEEVVEEWLNRKGYFTIRGTKVGVDEIDLMAIRFKEKGVECRHIEVQASIRPIGCIAPIPKHMLKEGQSSRQAGKKRSDEVLKAGVKEWVQKKFMKENKLKLMKSIFPCEWSKELVVNEVLVDKELEYIKEEGIKVTRLTEVWRQLNENKFSIKSASGKDLIDLMNLGQDVDSKQNIDKNTIVVPARMTTPPDKELFEQLVFTQKEWCSRTPLKINEEIISYLTHIAFYQASPISAIQYIAEIDRFIPDGEGYKVIFKGDAWRLEEPVRLGSNPNLAPQSFRYTSLDKLKEAKILDDIF